MNKLTFEFTSPEIKAEFDWQLSQELNVFDGETLIAQAEFEVLTLNKNRGAKESYQKLLNTGTCDWEIPLNLYFTKQNLKAELAETLSAKTDAKKAQQHIMIEAIAVLPEYRGKGIAKAILGKIAAEYHKAQSIFTLAMPMANFVDPEACEIEQDKIFYQGLALEQDATSQEEVTNFFTHNAFQVLTVDESLLAEPLPYTILVTAPAQLAK